MGVGAEGASAAASGGQGGRDARLQGSLGRRAGPGAWLLPRSSPPRALRAPGFRRHAASKFWLLDLQKRSARARASPRAPREARRGAGHPTASDVRRWVRRFRAYFPAFDTPQAGRPKRLRLQKGRLALRTATLTRASTSAHLVRGARPPPSPRARRTPRTAPPPRRCPARRAGRPGRGELPAGSGDASASAGGARHSSSGSTPGGATSTSTGGRVMVRGPRVRVSASLPLPAAGRTEGGVRFRRSWADAEGPPPSPPGSSRSAGGAEGPLAAGRGSRAAEGGPPVRPLPPAPPRGREVPRTAPGAPPGPSRSPGIDLPAPAPSRPAPRLGAPPGSR